jgi:hypothetical protein
MSGVTINPALMTNAAGSFATTSEGYVQGFALDDPAVRNELCSGILSPAAAGPIWGACAITESLPTAGTEADAIGSVLALATAEANLTGWTVYNQSAALLQSAQSPAPLCPPGGSINFYRNGSEARIAVACSQAVAAALAGQPVNTAVYWDYVNQLLLNAPGGTALNVLLVGVVATGNAQVVSYNSGTGLATWSRTGYLAIIQLAGKII